MLAGGSPIVPGAIKDSSQGGIIKGTASLQGTPTRSRVAVFRRSDFGLVAIRKTTNDGTYLFNFLPRGVEYTVLGIDIDKQNNAVAADRITPVNTGDL